jgi:hypothetical protein
MIPVMLKKRAIAKLKRVANAVIITTRATRREILGLRECLTL